MLHLGAVGMNYRSARKRIESFNGKLRDECLNGEIFYSLKEAQIVIEKWRVLYNTHGCQIPIRSLWL